MVYHTPMETRPMEPENLIDELEMELRRIFGDATVEPDEDGCIVHVPGWPDAQVYRPEVVLPVLARFADGHGLTDEGDAEVCAALERAGAAG